MLVALTPPVKVANASWRPWVVNVVAYACAGVAASALVGVATGGLGDALGLSLGQAAVAAGCVALAVAVAVFELGPWRLPLPQAHRASNGYWARRWGQPVASMLWGFDIGLFFTTWLTFAGAWWLVAVAIGSGDMAFAVALFAAFWLGRVLTVALGPRLVPTATSTPWIVAAVEPLRGPFRRVHVGVVVLASAAVAASALLS